MGGYAFSDRWAKKKLEAIAGFLRASVKADKLLATSDEEWERIKPLMQV